MDYYQRIGLIAQQNNGIVTSKSVREEGIPSIYLTRMVKQNKLKKLKRGIYALQDAVIDEDYILYLKNSRIIFSFTSALFLHGLTDRMPYNPEVTLPNTYNSAHIDNRVVVHKVLKKYYGIGRIIKETIHGNGVPCYDMERVLCDLIRFRDSIDVEIFRKAVRSYKNHPDRNLHRLRDYGKIFGIAKKVNDLMDVI